MDKPSAGFANAKVSVAMITYNHEAFIAQAIEGVMMQQTDFPLEMVIGEDCSTDGTRTIVKNYAERHSERIRLFLHERNKGAHANVQATLDACRGEYIAICEGDDYWTDPHKIQKQVNFLETHLDFSFCFHWVDWLEQTTGDISNKKYGPPIQKSFYTTDDLLEYGNFIPTCSVVFRNRLGSLYPDWFYQAKFGDFPTNIMNSQYGKIGLIDESMAVYRKHQGGVFSGNNAAQNLCNVLETYTLIGKNLHLEQRASYHVGVTKNCLKLFKIYRAQGAHRKALSAGYRAVKFALFKDKFSVVGELFQSISTIKRFNDLTSRTYKRIRRQGE